MHHVVERLSAVRHVLVNRARSTLPTAEAQSSTANGASPMPLVQPGAALPELKKGPGDDEGKKLADSATTEKDSTPATAHLPTRHPLSSSHEKARLRALQSKRWSCVKLASAAVMHFTALAHDNQGRQDAKDKEQKAASEAAAAEAAAKAAADSGNMATNAAAANTGDATETNPSGRGEGSNSSTTAAPAATATGGADSKKATTKVTPSTKLPALKQSGGAMSKTTRKLKKNGLGGIMDSFGDVVLKVRN